MKTESGEHLKPKSQYADDSVQLAVAASWDEAAELNQFILDQFGPDEQAYNRLGKALTEMGNLADAKSAYEAALALNPMNSVARKNALKLETLLQTKEGGVRSGAARVDLNLFVEEMGKTVVTTLETVNDPEISSRVAAGDIAELKVESGGIAVQTVRGVRIGLIESKLARRLIKFIEGGNRYQAGVTSAEGTTIKLIIRESYQDPKFAGKPSFPMTKKRITDFRPYTKESLINRDIEIFSTDDDDEVLPAGRGGAEEEEGDGLHEVDEETETLDFSEEESAEAADEDDDEEDE